MASLATSVEARSVLATILLYYMCKHHLCSTQTKMSRTVRAVTRLIKRCTT